MYTEPFLLTAESYIVIWFDNEGCIYSQNTKISLKLKILMEEKGGI